MISETHCPVGRWLRRKEARPAELIDAALDLFVERGYAATKMEDIAKRAGVTKGTAYLYFCNKEELFKAVIREALLPRVERGEALLEDFQGTAWAAFETLVREWWATMADPRLSGIPKLMCAECGNFPELAQYYKAQIIDRTLKLMLMVLERGMASGEFRRIDADYAVRVLAGPLVKAMLWKHSFGLYEPEPTDYDRFLSVYFDLIRAALAAPVPVSPDSLS